MGSKKKKKNEPESVDLIQIMTVSLFIILLAFFILLNAIAVVDEKKKLAAFGSLLESFGVLYGGFSTDNGAGDNFTPLESGTYQIDFSELFTEYAGLVQNIRIISDNKKSVVSIPAHMLFERHGTTIIPENHKLLDRLCGIINKSDYPVDISVHTDNVSINKTEMVSNRELSTIRAFEVLKYFISKGKVIPNRLTAFGWGEYRPIASNTTLQTRAINRRIDIAFFHKRPISKPNGVFTFRNFFFKLFE